MINKAWRTLKGPDAKYSTAQQHISSQVDKSFNPRIDSASLETKVRHIVSSNEEYINRQRPLSSRFPRLSPQKGACLHVTAPAFNSILERQAKHHHNYALLPQVLQDAMEVKFSNTMDQLRMRREGFIRQ
jgi:hypothetical protein